MIQQLMETNTALQTIGDRIRYARNQQKVKQAQLAEYCDTHINSIWGWENGRSEPGLDNVRKLAAALDVPPAWLAWGCEAPRRIIAESAEVESIDPVLITPTHWLAKTDDPDTSHAAAEAAGDLRKKHIQCILARMSSGRPMAAEEVAGGYLDPVAVNRRFIEMERAGLIERTHLRHRNRSGRMALKWRLVRGGV